ncbi:MAG TPA: BrnT family toxin [Acidobacteriaceae bacterium]|nr:BrnT family toxin [Acidobacteriaceae bacterium]
MIVWDEKKRQANLEKHGLDFRRAYLVFNNPNKITFFSPREDERRLVDVAMVELAGRLLSLVYAERGDDIRVISFRVASRRERRAYEQQQGQEGFD